MKFRCSFDHFRPDLRKFLHIRIDRSVRLHKRNQLVNYFFAIIEKYGNFYDGFFSFLATGGFYINYSVHVYFFINFPKSPLMMRFPAVRIKLLVVLSVSIVSSVLFSCLGLPGLRLGWVGISLARFILSDKISNAESLSMSFAYF